MDNNNEAKNWLKNNKNSSPLASNRFISKKDVLEFIENLYSQGALKVLVTNILAEDWRLQQEGGEYSNSLLIILPKPEEADKRRSLFEIFNQENKREGFANIKDNNEISIELWWD